MKKSGIFKFMAIILIVCFAAAMFGGCKRVEKTEQEPSQTEQNDQGQKADAGEKDTAKPSEGGKQSGQTASGAAASTSQPGQASTGDEDGESKAKPEIKELAVVNPASYEELYKALTAASKSGWGASSNGDKAVDARGRAFALAELINKGHEQPREERRDKIAEQCFHRADLRFHGVPDGQERGGVCQDMKRPHVEQGG